MVHLKGMIWEKFSKTSASKFFRVNRSFSRESIFGSRDFGVARQRYGRGICVCNHPLDSFAGHNLGEMTNRLVEMQQETSFSN